MDIDNRGYLLVGAFWGRNNMIDKFLSDNYWENGWDDRFLNKVNDIKVGDYIGIKTLK